MINKFTEKDQRSRIARELLEVRDNLQCYPNDCQKESIRYWKNDWLSVKIPTGLLYFKELNGGIGIEHGHFLEHGYRWTAEHDPTQLAYVGGSMPFWGYGIRPGLGLLKVIKKNADTPEFEYAGSGGAISYWFVTYRSLTSKVRNQLKINQVW